MTDYKQLCAELVNELHAYKIGNPSHDTDLIDRARAALAQPEPEGANNEPKIGDYVLATKWSDGDPCDHFCVGFFAGKDRDRYKVVDSDGNLFRANGFRRCETITQAEGESILSLKIGDKPGPSVWWHLERIRGIEAQPESAGPTLDDIWELCEELGFELGIDRANEEESVNFLWEIARAVLARWGRPAPQPVQVSERLPGAEDCDAEGRCWWGRAESDDWSADWTLATPESVAEFCEFTPRTVWLPAHALPLPRSQ